MTSYIVLFSMAATVNLENLPGVGPATADKLVESGYDSYQGIAVASPGELAATADIGENSAAGIISAARDVADIGGFKSGSFVLDQRNEIGKLSWQVDAIDDLLGGGVETHSITEVYGEFGVGKSQATHQLAVNVQLPFEYGGLEGRAIFIDSEDTFRPERIEEMVRGLPTDILAAAMDQRDIEGAPENEVAIDSFIESVLERIHVAKAFNSDHQMLLAQKAQEIIAKHEDSDWPVRLVCVDSLTAHFRAEYVGRGKLAERQQKLNRHLHDLSRITDLYNAAVLVTNQVQSNPDSYFGDPTKPIGGNILGHKSTVRLYLRNSKGTKRIVRLVDAPNLPDGEAVMRVENEGLVDE